MKDLTGYIGVFDSGVGGLSVLKECVKVLPNEKFYFYGDSKHAPYGEKSIKEIQDRTLEAVNKMVNHGVKAVVIACNTATSAAITILRAVYDIPVIGIEPALKMAVDANCKKILVAATPNTLKLEKYHQLEEHFKDVEVINVECHDLAKTIEEGHLNDDVLQNLLEKLFSSYKGQVDGIVFGCTHYPLIKDQILQVFGDIPTFDGSVGTALQLKRKLEEANLLDSSKQDIIFESSLKTDAEINFYKTIFQ